MSTLVDKSKSIRVGRKINWIRKDLKERGCARCGYAEHANALRHLIKGKTPSKIAYDDGGWKSIHDRAKAARVLCLNCVAVEAFELKAARLLGAINANL